MYVWRAQTLDGLTCIQLSIVEQLDLIYFSYLSLYPNHNKVSVKCPYLCSKRVWLAGLVVGHGGTAAGTAAGPVGCWASSSSAGQKNLRQGLLGLSSAIGGANTEHRPVTPVERHDVLKPSSGEVVEDVREADLKEPHALAVEMRMRAACSKRFCPGPAPATECSRRCRLSSWRARTSTGGAPHPRTAWRGRGSPGVASAVAAAMAEEKARK